MESIQTHPATAAQAKAFTAPGSLSFPNAQQELLTPPATEQKPAVNNGPQPGPQASTGPGVTPATPSATPVAMTGGSGLTPTLQYVLLSP